MFFLCSTATWPKRIMSNKDVIRMKIACDVMELDDRQSIHNAAVNAFGAQGVNTHMYVPVLLSTILFHIIIHFVIVPAGTMYSSA